LEGLVTAFNAMRERLLDSFLRLTEFSDDLAHELRTPINNLLLQTQVTLDGEASLEHYRAALQANEEECQRLSRMISDMLFLAKADNRLVHPKREPLILGQEVSALLDFYEPLASEGGIQLEQSGSATLSGDRLMLRRALSNLLSNAIRYTAPGLSVCVCIDASEPDWVSLSVTNPGPEIPVDQRERIFERLYRGDPSRQDGRSDNVGLGLAISRSIAKLHGGDILVSCLDGENTFTLRLPREAPSEGAAQPEISK
jgi:two-component system heavy metal sensor histidine kinase CusS